MLMLLLLACPAADPEPPAAASPGATEAPTQSTAATPEPSAPKWAAVEGREAPDTAWGAVFWNGEGDRAYRIGGTGDIAFGREGAGPITPVQGEPLCAGAQPVAAPPRAALVLPPSSNAPPADGASAIDAAKVERAGFRLHEVLPPADKYTPRMATRRATDEGVELGSVLQVRRRAAPPILLVSGTRSCTTVVAALDLDGTEVLSWLAIPDMCSPAGMLAPKDLDGDTHRETAATAGDATVGVRIVDEPAGVTLERFGLWRCPEAPSRRDRQLEQAG